MFGMSLIAALGTAFLAGPDRLAGEIESGHRPLGPRPAGPPLGRAARQVARAGRLRQRLRRPSPGLAQLPRRPADRRLLAAAAGRRHCCCSRPRRSCCSRSPCCCRASSPRWRRASSRSACSGRPGSPAWSAGIGQALGNDGVGPGRRRSRGSSCPPTGCGAGRCTRFQDPAALAQFGFQMDGFPFLSEAALIAGLPGLGGRVGADGVGTDRARLLPPRRVSGSASSVTTSAMWSP